MSRRGFPARASEESFFSAKTPSVSGRNSFMIDSPLRDAVLGRTRWLPSRTPADLLRIMTTTLSLKLSKALAARLEVAARARKTTPAQVARECLERELPASEESEPWILHSAEKLPPLSPGESAYEKMLPVLKKAWAKGRKLPRDLSTNPKHMDGFGQ